MQELSDFTAQKTFDITFPGGLPIVDEEGILIGAIGVSRDKVENHHLVTKPGVSVADICDVPKHPWRT